jgi:DNA modification methylase
MAERGRGLELLWPGKYGPDGERSPLPQPRVLREVVERVPTEADAESPGPGGRVMVGDNLHALVALADELEGGVDLAYIDPPFATGASFSVVRKLGEDDDGPQLRVPAYEDSWPGGAAGLLEMLDPRVRLIHRLLAPDGSLYVHVDPTVGHAVKLLLDDVFGERCFQREIVWRIGWLSGFKTRAKNWIRNHDLIFFYVKDPERFTFNKRYVPHPEGYLRRDGKPPTSPGVPLEDVWNANESEFALRGRDSLDSIQIKSFSREKSGWATQKNESVLERIIEASSDPGDLVLDAFAGSGTTAVVAARLGRGYVACDRSEVASFIARGRLLDVPGRGPLQIEHVREAGSEVTDPAPASFELVLETTEAGLALRLVDFATDRDGLPEEARDAPWDDLVEAWAVDWSNRDPFTTDFETHRRHHRRALSFVSAPMPDECHELAVTVWDVLGRGSRARFRIDGERLTRVE